jgi:hypothetical protein
MWVQTQRWRAAGERVHAVEGRTRFERADALLRLKKSGADQNRIDRVPRLRP